MAASVRRTRRRRRIRRGGTGQAVAPDTAGGIAPLVAAQAPTVIPEQYVVVFKTGTSATGARAAKDRARGKGARIQHEYGAALNGFAATLPAEALDEVRRDANVDYVEADQTLRVVTTQTPVTWGLDRIDQPALPLSNSYTYNFDGTGVTAYVIDTGIRFSHTQFAGRAVSGFDVIDGGSAEDCNGHGTHVAGTIGATTYGVAKNVALTGVRVLNCQGSGSTSQVVAGINWVTDHHAAGAPAVANMSLGGAVTTAIDNAVTNSINDGITYAVAAGNSNADACGGSPSRVPDAITVGATTMSDTRSSFSNFGTCLDIFAPGSDITSAWITSDRATNTISGTSMASPHVAGAAALVLHETPAATPAAVRTALVNKAVTGVLSNVGSGSPNRMLNALNVTHHPHHRLPRRAARRCLLRERNPLGHRRPGLPPERHLLLQQRFGHPPRLPRRAHNLRLRPLPVEVDRPGLGNGRPEHQHRRGRGDQVQRHRRLLHLARRVLHRQRHLHLRPDPALATAGRMHSG